MDSKQICLESICKMLRAITNRPELHSLLGEMADTIIPMQEAENWNEVSRIAEAITHLVQEGKSREEILSALGELAQQENGREGTIGR